MFPRTILRRLVRQQHRRPLSSNREPARLKMLRAQEQGRALDVRTGRPDSAGYVLRLFSQLSTPGQTAFQGFSNHRMWSTRMMVAV
jgi:hypothetical protein